ncbi:MAG: InlB B-repeat-containing protein, partial [Nitrososphaerota archaeon]|nr:InlB B-repeat-containing protein [Nitrososphaerota archaeon]
FVIPAGTIGRVELAAIFDTVPKGFDINYVLNGGVNNPSNKDSYFGDNDNFPIDFFAPSKSGYTFAGWTVEYSNGQSPITTPTTSFSIQAGTIEAITLTAHWSDPVNYTITYALNGGINAAGNPTSYTISDLPLRITAPTRTGYPFQHWTATCANGTQTQITSNEIPQGTTGNLTLTAIWDINNLFIYNIIYILNGGTLNPACPTTYTIEDAANINITTIGIPTKLGYDLQEWFVVIDDGTIVPMSVDGLPAGTTGDIIIVAFWSAYPVKYIIEYEVSGGVVTGNPASYTIESSFPIYIRSPTRAGYEFQYWLATCANGTQLVLPSTGIPAGTTGNILLTAIWNIAPTPYSITYTLNGGTNTHSNPASYTNNDLPLNIAVPTKAGYPFLHWIAKCSNGSQITLAYNEIPADTTGNLTLSAVWDTDNPFVYDITYMLNGGSLDANRPTKYTIENATKVNLANVGTPTKTGYNIDKWFVVTEDGTFIDVSAAGLPAGTIGNIIVVVFWVEYPIVYTIDYELAGGVNVGNAVDYSVESRFDIYIHAPIRAGYNFMYWMVTCANGTQLRLPATGIPKGTAGDLKLTAVWSDIIVYTITYDLNGGVPSGYNPTAYTVESGAINLFAPVKAGYTFKGWTITYNYGSSYGMSWLLYGSVISAGTTGNILLSAEWAAL